MSAPSLQCIHDTYISVCALSSLLNCSCSFKMKIWSPQPSNLTNASIAPILLNLFTHPLYTAVAFRSSGHTHLIHSNNSHVFSSRQMYVLWSRSKAIIIVWINQLALLLLWNRLCPGSLDFLCALPWLRTFPAFFKWGLLGPHLLGEVAQLGKLSKLSCSHQAAGGHGLSLLHVFFG